MQIRKYVNKGFTLIELLVVVAVVALLAILAINVLTRQIFKGNDARRKADLNRIGVAVEEYEKDHNCYPPAGLVVCKPQDTGLNPYLNRIPCDPVTDENYYYEPGPGACPVWYRLYTGLQNTADAGIVAGIGPGGAYNFYTRSANAPVLSGGGSATPPGGGAPGHLYGCKNGECVQLTSPYCSPNFSNSNCNNNICPTDPDSSLECK